MREETQEQADLCFMWIELILIIILRDGSQQELMARNNALRQSTYPALAINALRRCSVTYKPENLQDHKVAIRAAYGKIYQWDEEGKRLDE